MRWETTGFPITRSDYSGKIPEAHVQRADGRYREAGRTRSCRGAGQRDSWLRPAVVKETRNKMEHLLSK